jgi:pimeloyl-ACP methyl ester carboxylesterase
VVEGGSAGKPVVFFLHGWPESWAAHEQVMIPLGDDAHVVAIDLPGIGGSTTPPPSGDKRSLAGYARGVIEALKLREVTLVGHDVGGMIVYAYLRRYSGELRRAVIINVAIPGVDPWPEVASNPAIWHFAFHAVPDLPERLVMGHQREYFDYFYNLVGVARCRR